MNPDNISAAAWDAISAQRADDDRAFSAVERMVDRRWKPKGGH